LDYLSERRNSEVALLVRDVVCTETVRGIYGNLLKQSTPLQQGELFRYEAREQNVDREDVRDFRRLRFAAPFIQKYL
jgi:hypothetical protein